MYLSLSLPPSHPPSLCRRGFDLGAFHRYACNISRQSTLRSSRCERCSALVRRSRVNARLTRRANVPRFAPPCVHSCCGMRRRARTPSASFRCATSRYTTSCRCRDRKLSYREDSETVSLATTPVPSSSSGAAVRETSSTGRRRTQAQPHVSPKCHKPHAHRASSARWQSRFPRKKGEASYLTRATVSSAVAPAASPGGALATSIFSSPKHES